jgi:hypothetical protein
MKPIIYTDYLDEAFEIDTGLVETLNLQNVLRVSFDEDGDEKFGVYLKGYNKAYYKTSSSEKIEAFLLGFAKGRN